MEDRLAKMKVFGHKSKNGPKLLMTPQQINRFKKRKRLDSDENERVRLCSKHELVHDGSGGSVQALGVKPTPTAYHASWYGQKPRDHDYDNALRRTIQKGPSTLHSLEPVRCRLVCA